MSYWDTIVIGEKVEIGSHRFEATDIKRFAAKYDPQPFHLDEEAARHSVLGGLCASGWHTTAVWMRLNIDSQTARINAFVAAGNPVPKVGPSPGLKNLRWLKPIYAGDTVTFTQHVTAKRKSASRPGWGVIEFSCEGVNQSGETVFSFHAAAFYGTD
ncbi:MAG: MaoC family dehydratase [Aurantimonas endophytica]|uniref:MaoC family dehydratase n=1 Tax=Aurantimonas endophytica TaxID=1522175 RepID=UPI003001ED17